MEISDSELYERMLNWRSIYPDLGDTVCPKCLGSGVKIYGSTSTWRRGVGGQTVTEDVCDKCWGSGKTNNPGVNLKKLGL